MTNATLVAGAVYRQYFTKLEAVVAVKISFSALGHNVARYLALRISMNILGPNNTGAKAGCIIRSKLSITV